MHTHIRMFHCNSWSSEGQNSVPRPGDLCAIRQQRSEKARRTSKLRKTEFVIHMVGRSAAQFLFPNAVASIAEEQSMRRFVPPSPTLTIRNTPPQVHGPMRTESPAGPPTSPPRNGKNRLTASTSTCMQQFSQKASFLSHRASK